MNKTTYSTISEVLIAYGQTNTTPNKKDVVHLIPKAFESLDDNSSILFLELILQNIQGIAEEVRNEFKLTIGKKEFDEIHTEPYITLKGNEFHIYDLLEYRAIKRAERKQTMINPLMHTALKHEQSGNTAIAEHQLKGIAKNGQVERIAYGGEHLCDSEILQRGFGVLEDRIRKFSTRIDAWQWKFVSLYAACMSKSEDAFNQGNEVLESLLESLAVQGVIPKDIHQDINTTIANNRQMPIRNTENTNNAFVARSKVFRSLMEKKPYLQFQNRTARNVFMGQSAHADAADHGQPRRKRHP